MIQHEVNKMYKKLKLWIMNHKDVIVAMSRSVEESWNSKESFPEV